MLWRGGFRRDLDLNFSKKFKISRPQNFSSEIARDRSEIPADWWCAALPRAAEVPKHCAERQHKVARRISPRSGPKFFKFFRSRSRKIFFVRNRARSRRNPCRLVIQSLATSCRGPQALCGASAYSGAADFAAIWTEIFQNFRGRKMFFVRDRARSRRNPCRLVMQSLATSRRSPHALCGASACCGAADFVAIWTEIFQNFSRAGPQNFFVRNRARSRRNDSCRLVMRSIATGCRGPQALCGASACCSAADFAVIWTEIFQNFRGRKTFFRPRSR